MVLMAIDHVRVYSGVRAGGPARAQFFTRWVTHFCAPGFVFFAGTAAFLRGTTLPGTAALSGGGLWRVPMVDGSPESIVRRPCERGWHGAIATPGELPGRAIRAALPRRERH